MHAQVSWWMMRCGQVQTCKLQDQYTISLQGQQQECKLAGSMPFCTISFVKASPCPGREWKHSQHQIKRPGLAPSGVAMLLWCLLHCLHAPS